jgi:hypothetical protein
MLCQEKVTHKYKPHLLIVHALYFIDYSLFEINTLGLLTISILHDDNTT